LLCILWINVWESFRSYDYVICAEFVTVFSRIKYNTSYWICEMRTVCAAYVIINRFMNCKIFRSYDVRVEMIRNVDIV